MPRMTRASVTMDRHVELPLPLYATQSVGRLESQELGTFRLVVGLDEALVAQLRAYSLDERDRDIQDSTSDRERFGTGSYEEWYSKNRLPFALVDDSGALAAIVWFGPKPLGRKSLKYLTDAERAEELLQKEDVWHTLVYRSYVPYRGKGLMTPFVRACVDEYLHLHPEAKLWVGVSTKNVSSIVLASKLGFIRREDSFDAEKQWVAMVRE